MEFRVKSKKDKEKDNLVGQIEGLCSNVDDISKKLAQVEEQSASALKKIEDLYKRLEDQAQSTSEAADKRVINLETEVAHRELKIDSLENVLKSLKNQITKAEGERDTLKNDLTQLQGERDNLESELTRLRGERDNLKSELTRLQEQSAQTEDRLRGERDNLESELTRLQEQSAQTEDRLRGERDNLKSELTRLKEQSAQTEGRLREERDTLKADLFKLKGLHELECSKSSNLTHELKEAKHQNDTLKSEAHTLKTKITESERYMSPEDIALTTRLISLINERSDLQRALDLHEVWSPELTPKSKLRLITQATMDNRLKRVHDLFSTVCLEDGRSLSEGEFELLHWLLSNSNLSKPQAKHAELTPPEDKTRFNPNEMRPTKPIVAGIVTKTLVPGINMLKLKSLVEVSS